MARRSSRILNSRTTGKQFKQKFRWKPAKNKRFQQPKVLKEVRFHQVSRLTRFKLSY